MMQVFSGVMLYPWVSSFHYFEGLLFLHLQDFELLEPAEEGTLVLQNIVNY